MPFTHSQETHNSNKTLIMDGVNTKEIVQRTGVSKWTINRMRRQLDPNYQRPTGGRPVGLGKTTVVTLRFKVRSGSLPNARRAHNWLKEQHLNLSYRRTVQILHDLGLFAELKKPEPFLAHTYIKKRLKWARMYRNWTAEDWRKVVFSDETKVNLWGSDGVQYTWKQEGYPNRPHHYKQKMKHSGGSLMMWGCMTALGPGYACKIEDKTLNSEGYTYCFK